MFSRLGMDLSEEKSKAHEQVQELLKKLSEFEM
jgi:hypothetical protein